MSTNSNKQCRCTQIFSDSQEIFKDLRKVKDVDIDKMSQELTESDLLKLPSDDLDSLVKQYDDTLRRTLDKHAPLIERSIIVRENAPWFNDEIRKAKQERRRAERAWRKQKLQVQLDMIRMSRIKVNELCRQAKKEYYGSKISQCENDTKALYNITNSLIIGKQEPVLPQHDNSEKLANEFIEFFSDKITNIVDKFPNAPVMDTIQSDLQILPLRKILLSHAKETQASDTIMEQKKL